MLLYSERVYSDLLLATLLYTLNYTTLNSSLLYSISCSTLQEKNSSLSSLYVTILRNFCNSEILVNQTSF